MVHVNRQPSTQSHMISKFSRHKNLNFGSVNWSSEWIRPCHLTVYIVIVIHRCPVLLLHLCTSQKTHSTHVVLLLGLSVANGGPTVRKHATGKMFFVELIRCMAVSVLLALYPPQTKNYSSHDRLTLVMLHCLFLFFIHLKLELLTQIPASNDEKYGYL